jgi:hypothetical protein
LNRVFIYSVSLLISLFVCFAEEQLQNPLDAPSQHPNTTFPLAEGAGVLENATRCDPVQENVSKIIRVHGFMFRVYIATNDEGIFTDSVFHEFTHL